MPRGIQPEVPIYYDAAVMIMHGQRILPSIGLKPKKDKNEETRQQEFASKLAVRPSFGGQLPGGSSSPGLQNLDDLTGAFHGVGEDDDGKNQQEPLFSRSNAVDCQLHEAIEEVKRLYACLRWLLQERSFEDGLEEDEDDKEKDPEADTGNTFLSSARDNKRWRDFAERDAGVAAKEVEDLPEVKEEKEQQLPQSHSRYRLFDPSTGASTIATTPTANPLETPSKAARASLSLPKPRRSRMGTLKGPPKDLLTIFEQNENLEKSGSSKAFVTTALGQDLPKPEIFTIKDETGNQHNVRTRDASSSVSLELVDLSSPSFEKKKTETEDGEKALSEKSESEEGGEVTPFLDRAKTDEKEWRDQGTPKAGHAPHNSISIASSISETSSLGNHQQQAPQQHPPGVRRWVSQATVLKSYSQQRVSNSEKDRPCTEIPKKVFRRFVGKALQKEEEHHYRKIWQELGHSDTSASGGHHPQLTIFEHHAYKELMVLLERLPKTGTLNAFLSSKKRRLEERLKDSKLDLELQELEKGVKLEEDNDADAASNFDKIDSQDVVHPIFGPEEERIVRQCKKCIQHLRSVEVNPKSWHSGGFLNKIDNYVAVLLYRRYKNHKFLDMGKKKKRRVPRSTLPNTAKFAQLLHAMRPHKCPTVLHYIPAVAILSLLYFGIIALWAVWHYQIAEEYSKQVDLFSTEISYRLGGVVASFLNVALGATAMQTAFFASGLLNFDAALVGQPDLDWFVLDPIQRNSVTGSRVITNNGLYLASYSDRTSDYSISQVWLSVIDNTTAAGCQKVYNIDSDVALNTSLLNRRPTTSTLYCPNNNTENDLSQLLNTSENAGWSTIYPLTNAATNATESITYWERLQDWDNNTVGLVATDLSLESLQYLLSQIRLPRGGVAYVLDANSLPFTLLATTSNGKVFKKSLSWINNFFSSLQDIANIPQQPKKYDTDDFFVIAVTRMPVPVSSNESASTESTWLLVSALDVEPYQQLTVQNDGITGTLVALLSIVASYLGYYAFKEHTLYIETPEAAHPLERHKSNFREDDTKTWWRPYHKPLAKLSGALSISIIFIICIYLIWSQSSPTYVDEVQLTTTNDAHMQAIFGVTSFLNLVWQTGEVTLARWNSDQFIPTSNLPPAESAMYPWANETYDQYFYQLLQAINEIETSNLKAVSPSHTSATTSIPAISHVYVGFADGTFAGAEWAHDAALSTPIIITTKDNLNGNCYSKYFPVLPYGIRDPSQELWRSGDCSFDPRERSWYKSAALNGRPLWTPMFAYGPTAFAGGADSENDVLGASDTGITLALPFYTTNGGNRVLQGVLGVDLSVHAINLFLNATNADLLHSAGNTLLFMLERSTEYIVASSPQQEYIIDGLSHLQKGVDYGDITITTVTGFLTNPPWELSKIKDSDQFRRSLDFPYLNIRSIKSNPEATNLQQEPYQQADGLDWVSILVTQPQLQLSLSRQLSFLISLAVLIVFLWLLLRASYLIRQKWMTSRDHHETALRALGGRKVRKEDLLKLRFKIREIILKSANNHEDCPTNKTDSWDLIEFGSIHEHYSNMAVYFINACKKKRNILTIGMLHDFPTTLPLRIYKVYTSGRYKMTMYIVMITHILLCLAEPPTLDKMRSDGVAPWVLGVEAICLTLEFMDLAVRVVMSHKWKLHNYLSPSNEDIETFIRCALTFLIFIDWFLECTIRFSWEYYIPLRPFILVGKNSLLRKAAGNFIQTLYHAWDVFLLAACIILCASVFGIFLFRDILNNSTVVATYDFLPYASFQHIFSALTTLVVYCTTAENYPDMIYVVYDASPWKVLYFATLFLLSVYFVLALVIGVFQDGFTQARSQVNQKRALFARTGLVSAFCLLDLQCNSAIPRLDFERFVFRLAPHLKENREALDVIYLVLRKQFEHDSIDISEFVQGVEMLQLGKRKFKSRITPWRLSLQAFFDQDWLSTLVTAELFLHLWVVCLYGTYENETLLDYAQGVIFILYTIEFVLKLIAFSPGKYWNIAYFVLSHQSHSWIDKMKKMRKGGSTRMTKEDPSNSPTSSRRKGVLTDSPPKKSTLRPGIGVTVLTTTPQSAEDYEEMERERKETQKAANELMFAHRFELVLVAGSAGILLLLVILNSSGTPVSLDMFRFVLSLSTLRVFAMFKSLRKLTHALFRAMPHLWPILGLLCLLFIEYAIVGVGMFYGKYTALISAGISPVGPSCDTYQLCMLFLFNLFTGQNWQNVMYPGVDAYGWGAVLYFCSFVVIALILLGNLITALFLDTRRESEDE